MNKFFEVLAGQFPTLVVILAIFLLVWLLIREYTNILLKIDQSVDKSVDAKLGAALSLVEEASTRLREQESAANKIHDTISQKSQKTLAELQRQETETTELFNRVNSTLLRLEESIVDVENESVDELYYLAVATADRNLAMSLCQKILTHEDASSSELEKSGDLARRNSRRTLAIDLYRRAVEIDAENYSAAMELYCLEAETSSLGRDEAFSSAKKLAIKQMNYDLFPRLFNALIAVSRYSEMVQFCDRIIDEIGGRSQKIKLLALRNKAVGHKNEMDIDSAKEAFSQAFDISEDDENTLKAYLALLEEEDDIEEYGEISSKLIEIDPTDVSYYIISIRHFINLNDYQKASEQLEIAELIATKDQDIHILGQLKKDVDRYNLVVGKN